MAKLMILCALAAICMVAASPSRGGYHQQGHQENYDHDIGFGGGQHAGGMPDHHQNFDHDVGFGGGQHGGGMHDHHQNYDHDVGFGGGQHGGGLGHQHNAHGRGQAY